MIRVDYAGPGGACQGIRHLGLDSYGVEFDAVACATRAAAGHRTIRADLAAYRQPPHVRLAGYWGSPPCQTFSTAGNGDGRAQLDDLLDVIYSERWADADRFDPRTRHVIDSARCAATLGTEWVGMEQVPAVLPLWRALAHVLERHGYSTWTGVLCAADYGVPQTRRRTFLLASRTRQVAPPTPTHAADPQPTLFGPQLRPWVSMAEALGWGFHDDPSATITGGGDRWTFGCAGYRERLDEYVRLNPGRTPSQPNRRIYGLDEPAPTIAFGQDAASWQWEPDDAGSNANRHNGFRIEPEEAAILQGFPIDYPFQGSRSKQFEQIGNAVPPPLAAHVVAALTGRTLEEAA